FELDAGELREAAQAQFKDVFSLHLAQVEDLAEPRAGRLGIVRGTDDLDDLIDIEDRDEESFDQVQAFASPVEPEAATARRDAEPVVEVDLQQLLETQRAGTPVNE